MPSSARGSAYRPGVSPSTRCSMSSGCTRGGVRRAHALERLYATVNDSRRRLACCGPRLVAPDGVVELSAGFRPSRALEWRAAWTDLVPRWKLLGPRRLLDRLGGEPEPLAQDLRRRPVQVRDVLAQPGPGVVQGPHQRRRPGQRQNCRRLPPERASGRNGMKLGDRKKAQSTRQHTLPRIFAFHGHIPLSWRSRGSSHA